jgi:hypothetical protein
VKTKCILSIHRIISERLDTEVFHLYKHSACLQNILFRRLPVANYLHSCIIQEKIRARRNVFTPVILKAEMSPVLDFPVSVSSCYQSLSEYFISALS